ncbi:EamA family transporter [Paenibacillus sp. CAU 1782]
MEEIKDRGRHVGKLLMLLAAFLTATGQLFWKLGLDKWVFLAIGFLCYSIGALLMIKAFAIEKLSVAYPIMCASYVFALIYGYYLLGEEITLQKLAAVLLLGIGVTLTSVER